MATTSPDAPRGHGLPNQTAPPTSPTWLISPVIDLFFIANILWPLVFLLELWGGFEAREGVVFWQVYFVTTPHRWITLLIVFGDRQLTRRFGRLFFGLLFVIVAVCLSVKVSTGTLTCLLTVDYLWNAWHFAAQHHGIYRIYGRMNPAGPSRLVSFEKGMMRLLIVYAAVRVAGWSWPFQSVEAWLRAMDWGLLAIPLALLIREAFTSNALHPGRLVYLLSVCFLYSAMVLAVHFHRLDLVLMLTTASALFHAVEYLTIVSWRVQSRRDPEEPDVLSWLVPRWGLTLLLFVGIVGWLAWGFNSQAVQFWLLLNVMIAFLHYSYDGLIWKRKRSVPSTSG